MSAIIENKTVKLKIVILNQVKIFYSFRTNGNGNYDISRIQLAHNDNYLINANPINFSYKDSVLNVKPFEFHINDGVLEGVITSTR